MKDRLRNVKPLPPLLFVYLLVRPQNPLGERLRHCYALLPPACPRSPRLVTQQCARPRSPWGSTSAHSGSHCCRSFVFIFCAPASFRPVQNFTACIFLLVQGGKGSFEESCESAFCGKWPWSENQRPRGARRGWRRQLKLRQCAETFDKQEKNT